MAILWYAKCSATGQAVCVSGAANEGCEVVNTENGAVCTNHNRGDGGDPDVPPSEGGNFSKYELMEERGEICKL